MTVRKITVVFHGSLLSQFKDHSFGNDSRNLYLQSNGATLVNIPIPGEFGDNWSYQPCPNGNNIIVTIVGYVQE